MLSDTCIGTFRPCISPKNYQVDDKPMYITGELLFFIACELNWIFKCVNNYEDHALSDSSFIYLSHHSIIYHSLSHFHCLLQFDDSYWVSAINLHWAWHQLISGLEGPVTWHACINQGGWIDYFSNLFLHTLSMD